ncbi:hypothetical protein, partial [Streptomyces sp. NRRL S-337]|uniref:hypothetical protein n=1 Tax=Streptomyces sp. NRRL S-337 TaxID=1463900 RepID=UPI001F39BEA9
MVRLRLRFAAPPTYLAVPPSGLLAVARFAAPRTYLSFPPWGFSPLRLRRAGFVVGAVTVLRGLVRGLLSLYVHE